MRKFIRLIMIAILAAVVLHGAYAQGVQHAINNPRPGHESLGVSFKCLPPAL